MPTVKVHNRDGKAVGQLELSDAVFGRPIKEYLLWEAVVAQQNTRRRGTASTKERWEVQGSSRKIYKQKGTGRARHGSIRAPIFVGGGSTFGPKPRSYEIRLPKKVRKAALATALSLRLKEEKLVIVQDLTLDEIKTKRVIEMMSNLGVASGLIVEDKANVQLAKSTRNLRSAKYIAPEGLNVYDILRYPTLVISRDAVKQIERRVLDNG